MRFLCLFPWCAVRLVPNCTFLILTAVDTDVPDAVFLEETRPPADYQSESMFEAIAVSHYTYNEMGIALAAQVLLPARDVWIAPYSPCLWQGVLCEQGAIQTVRWDNRIRLKGLNIGWFPASTSKIEITEQTSVCIAPLETRKLPRYLRHIVLTYCRWRGHIDMTTLPTQLKSFESEFNEFMGPLLLTRLPCTLERVRIIGSHISMIYVDNGSLPKSLREFLVETTMSFHVKVREKKHAPDRRIIVKRC